MIGGNLYNVLTKSVDFRILDCKRTVGTEIQSLIILGMYIIRCSDDINLLDENINTMKKNATICLGIL
jgi:hypothetical protein